jgi:uncharacterized protein YdeI (YjbR/CyaY-like superfamily)
MKHKDGVEILAFDGVAGFEAWLSQNHDKQGAMWLRFYKKGRGLATISYKQAVDVALCWGWIDGLANKYDEQSYMQRFTPRRSRSIWSQINKTNIDRLTKEGRMRAPGIAQVAAAQADGRWDVAYAPSSEAVIPDDLAQLLKSEPRDVQDFANSLSRSNIYTIYFQLTTAMRPETRARRLAKILEMLRRKTLPR